MRRRHRRHSYGQEQSRFRFEVLKPILAFAIVGAMLLLVGSWFVRQFNGTRTDQNVATILQIEEGSQQVSVSLEGQQWKQATDGMKVYPGDRLSTTAQSYAFLQLFDGTVVRLNENSTLHLVDSRSASVDAQLSLHLEAGGIWMRAPSSETYTGSIKRYVSTNAVDIDLNAGAEVSITELALAVFEGEGIGNTVTTRGNQKVSAIVGEGQRLILPANAALGADLYIYRSALDPQALTTPFISTSREKYAGERSTSSTDTDTGTNGEGESVVDTEADRTELVVTNPKDQDIVSTSTVLVEGTGSTDANAIRINGYAATFAERTGAFSLELALGEKEKVQITIEELDAQGTVIDERKLTVFRDINPPDAPTFVTPVQTNGSFSTLERKINITGGAPQGAVGMIINGYRLRLFNPGDTTWKFIGNVDLGNMQEGENVVEAVAINKAGIKSEPAQITITIGESNAGITDPGDTTETVVTVVSDDEETVSLNFNNPDTLPSNDPLKPGGIRIDAPETGNRHATSENEVLIEGGAPPGTVHVYVNDYRLRLYNPTRRYWNYIASTRLNTLKRGENTYEVVARDEKGQILDRMTYRIEFTPQ